MKRLVLPLLSVLVFIGYFAWRDWGVAIDTGNDNHCAAVTSAFIVVGMGELGIMKVAGLPPMTKFLSQRARESDQSEVELNEQYTRLRQAVLDDPRLYNDHLVECIERTLPDPAYKTYVRRSAVGTKERYEETRNRIEQMKRQMDQAVAQ